jgi:putative ABC transport system ATP-binding protein
MTSAIEQGDRQMTELKPVADDLTLYELSDVAKAFGQGESQVRALDGVDLVIDRGEFLVVAGPSGSGKTTLLQLLGGLDHPTAGKIFFDGRDLVTARDAELTQLRLATFGFIFQQFNLVPTLNARQNVEAALAPRRLPGSERAATAVRLLAAVGLAARAGHLPSQLSGGEQQRVAIARALANDPRVLLADEPTGNLDTTTGRELIELLAGLNADRGLTIVLITHDPTVAESASRIVQMRDGRMVGKVNPEAKTGIM